ncbi:LacI family DNA-binding transcriptional regulator [Microbacterium soli]|uniref:LacI family DNA-binding transcriptional regulator n=1 Tax=Microbacterium soli TaxID=446075 RepID=A0ABP7N6Z6_9MICO
MGDTEGSRTHAAGVRDVAALAGVSRQTVSRVLNEHPDVAPATREKVLAAMSRLDYRVNTAARALGTRRSWTIGVLASDVLQFGPLRSLAALEASAREAGYWVSTAFADAGDPASVLRAIDHLRTQAVDGLVVFAPHARTLDALEALDIEIPRVLLHTAGRDRPAFTVDQIAGARMAVAALAERGHERIAHLSGPADWLEAEARVTGFRAELAARGLPEGVVLPGDWTPRAGFAAARAVHGSGVTGVFAANDQMALALMSGLRSLGIAVPEDVSVVGFDDIPDAEYSWPSLTTVRQDFEELARRAVAVLTGSSSGEEDPVQPVLITRESVVPPGRDPRRIAT